MYLVTDKTMSENSFLRVDNPFLRVTIRIWEFMGLIISIFVSHRILSALEFHTIALHADGSWFI